MVIIDPSRYGKKLINTVILFRNVQAKIPTHNSLHSLNIQAL